jgi:methylmalonyl-CoA/ethylmalonyl-CoA epimerase
MISRMSHVAVAVSSLEEAAAAWERVLGAPMAGVETVEAQGVRLGFVQLGEMRIELLEPTRPDSPIGRFLQQKGPGLHHVCFEVENLDERLRELEARGVRLIDREPRCGAGKHRIAFIHPSSTGGVLVELSEPTPSKP